LGVFQKIALLEVILILGEMLMLAINLFMCGQWFAKKKKSLEKGETGGDPAYSEKKRDGSPPTSRQNRKTVQPGSSRLRGTEGTGGLWQQIQEGKKRPDWCERPSVFMTGYTDWAGP